MSHINSHSLALQLNKDVSLRLARIFISHDGVEYEWDGIAPEPGDTLFVYYVKVSDETYRKNIPLDEFRLQHIQKITNHETPQSEEIYTIEKRTFEKLRGIKNDVTISYLHNTNYDRHTNRHTNITLYGDTETRQADLLPSLIKNGNIFQNDKSYWYMLNGPDYYSDEYYRYRENYDFFDVRVIDDHDEFNKEYTLLQTYVVTKVDRRVFFQEIGASDVCFRCTFKQTPRQRSRTPPRGGGGKTRRKFKVKKRRNRRIRNTMKRRKTAVKRRNGRK